MVSMADQQATSVASQTTRSPTRALRIVSICGCVLLAIFTLLYWLSPPFEYGSKLHRPNLLVVGLLVTASVVALFGLISALKVPQEHRRTLLLLIVSFAVTTRLIAVFTCPILEVDYFRYLWDGKVVAAGISPYLHPPEQILEATSDDTGTLAQLSELSLRTDSNRTILSRIHFEDHTTIYPPVSQVVFAAVMKWLPESASVVSHTVAMKLALVLFDLGALLLVYFLLRKLQRNIGWLIVYAWNPLVIKEIANGGHLDSIATFFMVLAVVLLVRWRLARSAKTEVCFLSGSGIALAMGFGAKLFPIILLPAMAVFVFRKSVVQAIVFSLLFTVVSALVLWPMIHPIVAERWSGEAKSSLVDPSLDQQTVNPKKLPESTAKHGAVGFFSNWRINDTVFSGLYLNFKHSNRVADRTPWFVLTTADFRERLDRWCRSNSIGGDKPAFFFAKALTLGAFLVFYCWQLVLLYRRKFEVDQTGRSESLWMLRRSALILVVFLFLQPTVNPWYFVWLMPLACFSNNRGWLFVSGLMLTYYSRFWFRPFKGPFTYFERNYSGVGIYDHFVVWVVLGFILGTLAILSRSDDSAECEPLASEFDIQ